jgi:hypothetical protein
MLAAVFATNRPGHHRTWLRHCIPVPQAPADRNAPALKQLHTNSSPHVMLPSNCAGTRCTLSGLRRARFWWLSMGYYMMPYHMPSWRWRQKAPPERYSKLIILHVVITHNCHLMCLSIATRCYDLEFCHLNYFSISTWWKDLAERRLNDLSIATRCNDLEEYWLKHFHPV